MSIKSLWSALDKLSRSILPLLTFYFSDTLRKLNVFYLLCILLFFPDIIIISVWIILKRRGLFLCLSSVLLFTSWWWPWMTADICRVMNKWKLERLFCFIVSDNYINPLKAELNPICHLLALLGGATIVVVSRLRLT